MSRTLVTVLGAGIQGVCAALALAHKGYSVQLVDQMPEPLLRASLRNEGKVHLGFVYAKDRSRRTSEVMLESALVFAPLLDSWTGGIDWAELRSRPFDYLVLHDSLVPPDQLFEHYETIHQNYRRLRSATTSYVGLSPERLWRPSPLPAYASPELVRATARTCEVSLNLSRLRERLLRALASSPRISLLAGRRIQRVERVPHGFRLEGTRQDGEPWSLDTALTVNCLWEGRLDIDRQLGTLPRRPWVYRLKYRVLGRLPCRLSHLRSLTLVLGPYGDVVSMGESSYFSWYPVCRQAWSSEVRPPVAWEAACCGDSNVEAPPRLAVRVLEALDRIVPGMAEAEARSVDCGIVFSWGSSDIDDPDSEFHQRFDIGVHEHDGYFSIDTGKFTCAPHHAQQLCDCL